MRAAKASYNGLRKLTELCGQRNVIDARADRHRQLLCESKDVYCGLLRRARKNGDAESPRAIDWLLDEDG